MVDDKNENYNVKDLKNYFYFRYYTQWHRDNQNSNGYHKYRPIL